MYRASYLFYISAHFAPTEADVSFSRMKSLEFSFSVYKLAVTTQRRYSAFVTILSST